MGFFGHQVKSISLERRCGVLVEYQPLVHPVCDLGAPWVTLLSCHLPPEHGFEERQNVRRTPPGQQQPVNVHEELTL